MRRGWFHDPVVPDADRRPVKRATVRRVAETFRPYRRKVAAVAVVILLSAALGVINPILIKVIFDRALFGPEGVQLGLLLGLVGLMVLIPIISAGLGIFSAYLSNLVGLRVMQDLRNALYAHLQRMPLRFFTSTRTGEIQSRLASDVAGVQTVVTDTASSILSNLVVILSSIAAMLVLSWQLTVLSLIMLPFFLWLMRRVGKARQQVVASTQESMADLTAITQETLSVSGVLLSKAFGRQRYEIDRFRKENERLTGFQIRQQMIGRAFGNVIYTFFSITPALVYLVAGLVMLDGSSALTAGTIVAFTTLQSRMFFPMGQMLQVGVEVQSAVALFDRIFEYLDMRTEIEDAPDARRVAPDDVQGRIRFRDVWFRYDAGREPLTPVSPPDAVAGNGDRRREWALQDVDMEIEPGQLAALVGPSGAGKTTVTYLVPRFYDPERGAVEIDGRPVPKVSLESLGEIVGMVTQETYLFNTSIRENLLYGNPGATEEQLIRAAKAAFIHDRVMELPDRYDTLVGERGYRMSGGEKQRLAIARVVLKDPRILILDEATSSLDTTSERLVQEALRPLMRGRTTIAIAHRLSTILAADVIFVLDRGRVVERGTHEELLRTGGLYATLYEQQFRGGAVEAECEDGVVMATGEVVRRPPGA
jgi:ATP-binding cassette, subfamily B, bacterial